MSNEDPLNTADHELEAALGALRPHPSAIDRDRMMFEVGRRSVHPRRPIAWQVLSGALAAALVLSLSLQRAPRQIERVVYVPAPAVPEKRIVSLAAPTGGSMEPPVVDSAPGSSSYLVLRTQMLENGFELWTAEPGRRSPDRSARIGSALDTPVQAGFFGRADTLHEERL